MRAYELFEKQILLMGGNAFKELNIRRIKRDEIAPTLRLVGKELAQFGFDYEYISSNMMGSSGKQEDSGDLDIAVDANRFTKRDLNNINQYIRSVRGDGFVDSRTLKGGQIQTAWPINGDKNNGYVQIDFILGDLEWLKFSHWSPGKDHSPYKGVWISTLLGVIAKIKKDYELYRNPETGKIEKRPDDYQYDPKNDERTARVGLNYDLEKGLNRSWMYQKKKGQGPSKVSPDEWETNVKLPDGQTMPPRFGRTGYINDPQSVIEMLFGPGIKHSDIETFEKLWAVVTDKSKKGELPALSIIADRFAEAMARSSSGSDFKDKDAILADPIFQGVAQ